MTAIFSRPYTDPIPALEKLYDDMVDFIMGHVDGTNGEFLRDFHLRKIDIPPDDKNGFYRRAADFAREYGFAEGRVRGALNGGRKKAQELEQGFRAHRLQALLEAIQKNQDEPKKLIAEKQKLREEWAEIGVETDPKDIVRLKQKLVVNQCRQAGNPERGKVLQTALRMIGKRQKI